MQSHDFDSVNCTIDAEDKRYVASLLRNNYSNTRLAVVREISANALDANIEANQIIVEGELEGDMNGDEKVIIRDTGNVRGNIVAPRVTLEDGAMFKGSIEMEPRNKNLMPNKSSSSSLPSTGSNELKTA